MPEESIWPEDDEAFPGLSEEEIQVPGRAEMNDFAREEKENAIAVARRELLPPTSRRSKQGNLQRKNPPLVRQANATAAKNQQRNAPLQGYQQRNVLLQVNQQRKVPSQGNQQRNVPARMNPQRNIPAQINQHRNTPAQINSQRNIPAQINQHRNTPVQINSQRNIPAQRNQQKIVPAQINSQRNIPAQRNQQRNVPSQINFQRNDNIPVLTSLSPTSRNVTSPESNVLFITAVPRCGTVTLGALLRRLSSENKFLLETPHDDVKPWMTNGEKQSLLQHLRDLSKGAPVAYLRHLLFFDAARIGILKPIWMAIVRDPVERLISQFYYLRKVSTDSYVKSLDLNSCVRAKNPLCFYNAGSRKMLQLSFFCGHNKKCMEVGDRRALQMAKYHAETFYSVVGVLEDMSATYRALRHYLPRFFQRSFRADIVTENQRYNAHETARTPPVLNATKALMKSFLKEDYELYHFLRQRLHLQEKTV
ncbi:heparan sulfate 2-O-sulfotransferase 1-like isoform X1 [Penaeus indicus]|uniref:heparan sulfate 2-O-sulfotransferase 1-like isoform X1 n=1 Tax=Penaeus indicus TaxID=29960 RepID=UPI00300CCF10